MIPFVSFATMACFWTLARSARLAPVSVGALLAIALSTGISVLHGPYVNQAPQEIMAHIDPAWDIHGLAVLSTSVHSGPPVALALNTRWVGRFPHAWLIPGALKRISDTDCTRDRVLCEEPKSIQERSRRERVADIRSGKPDLLVFDKQHIFIRDPSFDWYSFLEKAPDWSKTIADYRRVFSDRQFDIWLRCADAGENRAAVCAATN